MVTDRLHERIRSRDVSLFDAVAAQLLDDDKRALLALHAAVAEHHGEFAYLEIGSYRGGSLQALVRDPRCRAVVSIDARVAQAQDGTSYPENSTAQMLSALRAIPGADLGKVSTIDATVDAIDGLPVRPQLCFVDGEHTDAAVLRDARFCAHALGDRGVVAFHDARLVAGALAAFLREVWPDAYALSFNGQVFAVELGGDAILRSAPVQDAIASRWHGATWRAANRAPSPWPLLAAWRAMPHADAAIAAARRLTSRGGAGTARA